MTLEPLGLVLLPFVTAAGAGALEVRAIDGGPPVRVELARPAASAAALAAAIAGRSPVCQLWLEDGRLKGSCTVDGRDIAEGGR